MGTLEIRDLHATVEGTEILKGVNLTIRQGEIHALMGPNGSGKSTLANTLLGHPKYKVTKGDILIDGESVIDLTPDKRAKKGLFLAFQYPVAVPGVTMFSFLRAAYNAVHSDAKNQPPTIFEFKETLAERMKLLEMDESFMNRYLNEGFSGGEKKRAEILQLAMLKPKFAVLDETDSGLDIDALRVVAEGVTKLSSSELGILVITHYQRILKYIRPTFVHVMFEGKITASGGQELSLKLEEKGYGWLKEQAGVVV
ncbi:MAG TPA: Fe-S cluster assembly ATPase SufC [Nitrososphaerales archaeon]|nr:Fe-S cluster assembly ATPase SufC [Nitrososphaerales archaeon]HUK74707.1 Fe-S cluster assembly ATPase SufC [Nitrososphaerales archaeon]